MNFNRVNQFHRQVMFRSVLWQAHQTPALFTDLISLWQQWQMKHGGFPMHISWEHQVISRRCVPLQLMELMSVCWYLAQVTSERWFHFPEQVTGRCWKQES